MVIQMQTTEEMQELNTTQGCTEFNSTWPTNSLLLINQSTTSYTYSQNPAASSHSAHQVYS